MKQKHILSIMIGFLIASAVLITGIASADITTDLRNKSMMHTQKLDTNDDGTISLDELTSRQNHLFAKLICDKNGMIEKREFNTRLITNFRQMDRDGNGVLRRDESPDHNYGDKKHQHGNEASDATKNS